MSVVAEEFDSDELYFPLGRPVDAPVCPSCAVQTRPRENKGISLLTWGDGTAGEERRVFDFFWERWVWGIWLVVGMMGSRAGRLA